jgi:hypothetical protein
MAYTGKTALVFLLLCLLLLPVMAGSQGYSVPVSVTVNNAVNDYTLSLDIRVLGRVVQAGGRFYTYLKLEKSGSGDVIRVELDYEIKDGEETLSSGQIGSVALSRIRWKIVRIEVPDDIEPGTYDLEVTATSPQADPASDTDDFRVRKKCSWWQFWCWFW